VPHFDHHTPTDRIQGKQPSLSSVTIYFFSASDVSKIEKERAFFSINVYGCWGSNHGVYTDFSKVFVVGQRYRSFITRIISARLVVIVLAMMMGQASIKTP